MSSPPRHFASRHALLGLFLLLGACSDSDNLIGPGNELEVTNAPDSFQWQASALSDVTQVLTYTWVNTGSTANVNLSSALSGGSAVLRVLDADGTEVFAQGLQVNGTLQTSTGASGNWTVTVSLDAADGTLNFRLQKP